MTIRLVLADDQLLLRTGFRMILGAEPDLEVVGDAADGRAAVEVARRQRADVVLMDIRMPGMDGIEATRLLAGPGVDDPVKVLILTTFDLDEYIVEALRAGASGFLLKDVPPEELVAAIRIVARGDALLAPSVTRRVLDRYARHLPPVLHRLHQFAGLHLRALVRHPNVAGFSLALVSVRRRHDFDRSKSALL